MRTSELAALAYFAYLIVAAGLSRASPAGRMRLAAAAAAAMALVGAGARLPAGATWTAVRDWLPGVYMMAGYWLPAWLVTAPDERLERRLLSIDRWFFSLPVASRPLPRLAREYVELAYLFCYPLVPAALILILRAADAGERSAAANRFWTIVLVAVFLCYGLLPWVQTRPPRALESRPPTAASGESTVRGMNLRVLHRASVQVNTFPSGHVAASLGAALAVANHSPSAALGVGVLALSIASGAVIGRYHYLTDAVLGAACALVAWGVGNAWSVSSS
jgi:hypothetical protein